MLAFMLAYACSLRCHLVSAPHPGIDHRYSSKQDNCIDRSLTGQCLGNSKRATP